MSYSPTTAVSLSESRLHPNTNGKRGRGLASRRTSSERRRRYPSQRPRCAPSAAFGGKIQRLCFPACQNSCLRRVPPRKCASLWLAKTSHNSRPRRVPQWEYHRNYADFLLDQCRSCNVHVHHPVTVTGVVSSAPDDIVTGLTVRSPDGSERTMTYDALLCSPQACGPRACSPRCSPKRLSLSPSLASPVTPLSCALRLWHSCHCVQEQAATPSSPPIVRPTSHLSSSVALVATSTSPG